MKSKTVVLGILLHATLFAACGDPERESARGAEAEGRAVAPEEVPPGAWDLDPESRWSLRADLRIGAVEGTSPDVFGFIRDIVPYNAGGVWVFDVQAYELRHFGADGQFLGSVGQQGQGPGEFSGNACARPGPDGEIWVETSPNWHRFDSSGAFLGTFRMPGASTCTIRRWLPDGRYLAAQMEFDRETQETSEYLVVYDWNGEGLSAVDTVSVPDVPEPETVVLVNASGNGRSERFIPFAHTPSWRPARDGNLWAWDGGGAYAFRLQSLDGQTLRESSRPYAPAPIDETVRSESIDRLQRPGWSVEGSFNPSQVPETYPPFSSVSSAEDGSVWVTREVGQGEFAWDIFSETGDYLGSLDVPADLSGMRVMHIGWSAVWGILRDELNVQYVVRAEIVRPNR